MVMPYINRYVLRIGDSVHKLTGCLLVRQTRVQNLSLHTGNLHRIILKPSYALRTHTDFKTVPEH